MKKALKLSFVCLLFLSFAAVPGLSEDASGVLKKVIDASGGRKALEKIKDTTISGGIVSSSIIGSSSEIINVNLNNSIVGSNAFVEGEIHNINIGDDEKTSFSQGEY